MTAKVKSSHEGYIMPRNPGYRDPRPSRNELEPHAPNTSAHANAIASNSEIRIVILYLLRYFVCRA